MRIRNILSISVLVLVFFLLTGCAADRAVVNRDKRKQALEEMGISLVSQGNLRAGLEYFLKAVELDPENAVLHHELAEVYKRLGQYDLSLQHFKKALDLKPDFSDAQNNLGTLYLLMQKWDLSIDSFQSAIDDLLYKTPDIAYNNMGLAYYYKGEYQKAINHYLMALNIFPSYAVCYFNLGLAYEALGTMEEAVDAYESAVGLAPEYWRARLSLGKLYLEMDRHQDDQGAR
ncbi:MAG: tetratricopeptide repeat protein [Deltaproteobacteria bacterium]|nr:tetratricopeptide repeat protein [Deltaproteobacteria bacterium]